MMKVMIIMVGMVMIMIMIMVMIIVMLVIKWGKVRSQPEQYIAFGHTNLIIVLMMVMMMILLMVLRIMLKIMIIKLFKVHDVGDGDDGLQWGKCPMMIFTPQASEAVLLQRQSSPPDQPGR